jgi:hypothetical protein
MSFFKPFVGMRDVYRASFAKLNSYAAPSSPLVGIWWGSWLVAYFIGRGVTAFARTQQNPSPKDLINSCYINMGASLIELVPIVLTMMLVIAITQQQTRKSQQRPTPAVGTTTNPNFNF